MIPTSKACKSNESISYSQRKEGAMCDLYTGIWEQNKGFYLKSNILKNSGRIFNASDSNETQGKLFAISGRFLTDPLYKKIGKYMSPTSPTTYIYVISKTIEGNIYYKVGEGGKGESKGVGRLGDAQTYLIPGLEDAGYKVHFVFFFRKNLHVNSLYIGQYIEKNIHKILRAYFKPINISYPNDQPSEWYLLSKKNEELFFLGFVFDIIGCYDHDQTKPFVIWKYETSGRSNVKILPGVVQRMKLNNSYNSISEKLKEFNLRKKERAIGLIVDKNNTEVYDEQLNILKRFFGFSIRDNIRTNPYALTFGELELLVTDFRSHTSRALEKYSKFYAVLLPNNETNLEKIEEVFNKNKIVFILTDNLEILICLKDFLIMYKEYYINKDEKWELMPIYDFYISKEYKKNIETIETICQKIPSWFYNKNVQLYWARKITNDRDWKRHEDYSINDEGDISLKKWEVYGYDEEDGVRIKRFQLDSNDTQIENTNEEVDALRIMRIMDVYKPEKIDKRILQKKREILQTATIESIVYKPGDIIEICDDYFLYYDIHGEPDGLPHKDWSKYKINYIYKNTRYDEDFLNPWLEVTHIHKGDVTKYDIVANEYIHKKMRKISERQHIQVNLSKDEIICIRKKNTKNVFSNKAWYKHDHYVIIDSIDREKEIYNLRMFAPFAGTFPISMELLHANIGDESIDDDVLEAYKKELLFKIMPISKIEGHKPQNATSHVDLVREGRRNPQYKVDYQDKNAEEMGIDLMQNAQAVKQNASRQVTSYWKTRKISKKKGDKPTRKTRSLKPKKTISKLYEFETLDANIDRAKTNWADHHNVNIKNISAQKTAYEYRVRDPDGKTEPFYVGDLFVLSDRDKLLKKGYITNFYYDESKQIMTYGVFFSSDDNQPTGNIYPEYTTVELVDLLKEGNTIPFLENLDNKVFGKMRRRYVKMIA